MLEVGRNCLSKGIPELVDISYAQSRLAVRNSAVSPAYQPIHLTLLETRHDESNRYLALIGTRLL